jgi:predicted dithiol-disulfide oxidoreductase (DUF899 family)
MALRRQIEDVARQRRELPRGGRVSDDYVFQTMDDRDVRLSELFASGKNSLVVYSYMFGPQAKSPCPSCTSIIDSLDGEAPHIEQRVNLVVVAKSPPSRIRDVASARGWRNIRLLSSAKNTYNSDYFAENGKESQMPMLNVFTKGDEGVYHAYGTELLYAPTEPGMDGRHVDMIWPLWNMFDYTPDGRGTTWSPRLTY